MRVAMVAPLYRPHVGGVEKHVELLVAGLTDLGHEVTVLTQEPGRRSPVEPGVRRFASLWPTDRYPVAPGLAVHLRRAVDAYDVVHAHSYHAASSLAGLVLPARVPLVFTPHYHGGGHTAFSRALHVVHRPLGRMLVHRAAALIAVSSAEAATLRSDFPGSDARISVVPNGVRRWRRCSDPAARPILLTVARLERYKRIDRVIDVLGALPEEWTLRIVGRGSQEAALKDHAARLGVEGRVRFDHHLSDGEMAGAFSAARVYISLSEHEAFGMTVLEAAAAGLPAVVSPLPAHLELRGVAPGWVIPVDAGDAGTVARQVLAAAAQQMVGGAGGLDWVEDVSWPAAARATSHLYQEVIASRQKGHGCPSASL